MSDGTPLATGRGFGTGAGNPGKLTPAVQQKIVDALRAGNYYSAAARYAGVTYSRMFAWMRKGEQQPDSMYGDFRRAVLEAEAAAEVAVVAQWRQSIPQNWAAARDFLARRYPERWAAHQKMELTGRDGGPVVLTLDLGTPAGDAGKLPGAKALPPSEEAWELEGVDPPEWTTGTDDQDGDSEDDAGSE